MRKIPRQVHPSTLAWLRCPLVFGHRAAVVAVFGGLLVLLPSDRAGAEMFVVEGGNAACSDAGPGTDAIPYCTISAAVTARSGPGVTVLVKPGIYRESPPEPRSGASGNPFVLKADGPGVVIDGSEDYGSPGLWTQFSGDVWRANVTFYPSLVRVDDAWLDNSGAPPPASLPPGHWRYIDGDGIYVNVGGGNPGERQTRLVRLYSGIFSSGQDWITIDGFQVKYVFWTGISVHSGEGLVVQNNSVEYARGYGIEAVGGSSFTITNNQVAHIIGNGIQLRDVILSTVARNVSHHNLRGINVSTNCCLSHSNLIQGNRVYENFLDGINFEINAIDNVCVQNLAWFNGDHGYQHDDARGGVHIGDVAWANTDDGFAFKDGSTGGVLSNCISVDNGLGASVYDVYVDSTSTSGFTSNDNIIWNSNGQDLIRFGAPRYTSIAAFTGATGHDTRSIQADPRFQDPAGGDFHLEAGSPAIDSGNSGVTGWPSLDADGEARYDDPATANTGLGPIDYADRGALEYRPGGAVAVDEVAPSGFALTAMFPNPMRGAGRFGFVVGAPAQVRVTVHDLQGRAVATLADRALTPGRYESSWSGRTQQGRQAEPGVFFLRLESRGVSLTRRFVLVH